MINKDKILENCFEIEKMVAFLVIRGKEDLDILCEVVSNNIAPEGDDLEEDLYAKVIVTTKLSILN